MTRHFSPALLSAALAVLGGPALVGTAQAAVIDAGAGSSYRIDFRVNDGGPLPTEIIAAAQGPQGALDISADLDVAGAVRHDYDTNIVAGSSAADPSQFGSTRADTHGVGDIASAQTNFYTYGIGALSPEPPNDFVESSHHGYGTTNVIVQSDVPMTGESFIDEEHSRDVVFQNLTGEDYFFTLSGTISAWSRAEFNGAGGFATALTEVGLRFESNRSRDITFAATSPFLPVQLIEGDTATGAIDRVTDVAGTGLLGISASAQALGIDPDGHELASFSGGYDYLLGVTLKPGEVLTMTHFVTYRNETQATLAATPVPLPASGWLLAGAFGLLARSLRRSDRGSNQRG